MDQFSLECHVENGEIHCEFERKSWNESGWGSSMLSGHMVESRRDYERFLEDITDWFEYRLQKEEDHE